MSSPQGICGYAFTWPNIIPMPRPQGISHAEFRGSATVSWVSPLRLPDPVTSRKTWGLSLSKRLGPSWPSQNVKVLLSLWKWNSPLKRESLLCKSLQNLITRMCYECGEKEKNHPLQAVHWLLPEAKKWRNRRHTFLVRLHCTAPTLSFHPRYQSHSLHSILLKSRRKRYSQRLQTDPETHTKK